MCRRQADTIASQPTRSSRSRLSSIPSTTSSSFAATAPSIASTSTAAATATTSSSSSSSLSLSSIASLRNSLPEKPILFSFPEIAAATNNFLTTRTSSSSYRCSLRGHDALVVPRVFRGDPSLLPARLSAVCRSHHRSIAKLLGASLSADRLHLVYRYVPGASLADCLRNPKNPSFTPLSSWLSRMQVATDLAQGLEYIHHHSAAAGIVHARIKSSAILVTEPSFNAVICHFAAAFLAGDAPEAEPFDSAKAMNRMDSQLRRIEGTRGYVAPEVIAGGGVSRGSDVYAFGVVMLELISGMAAVKFVFDRASKGYRSDSLVEIAREVFGEEGEGRGMRIRGWVDGRLRDSFPVEVAEKMVGIALRCVEEEAERRPSMIWVQGKVSKLFLDSMVWAERVKAPVDISVSLAPR